MPPRWRPGQPLVTLNLQASDTYLCLGFRLSDLATVELKGSQRLLKMQNEGGGCVLLQDALEPSHDGWVTLGMPWKLPRPWRRTWAKPFWACRPRGCPAHTLSSVTSWRTTSRRSRWNSWRRWAITWLTGWAGWLSFWKAHPQAQLGAYAAQRPLLGPRCQASARAAPCSH